MAIRHRVRSVRKSTQGGKYAGQHIIIRAVVNPEFKMEGKAAANYAIAQALVRALKRNTPVDTGRLQKNWKIWASTQRSFEVANFVFYGPFVDGGTPKMSPRRFVAKGLKYINTYVKRYYKTTPEQMYDWSIIEYRLDSYAGSPAFKGVLK